MDFPLTWDDSYAIALELNNLYPQIPMESVSLKMIYQWTISLPRFEDDYDLVNDDILAAIYREWYEEVISHE